MNYKIFVISLKRRKDRREKISELFKKYNLTFSFFDAIDGRDLIITDEVNDFFSNNEFEQWGIIKECIYGNTLSHLNLLKECSQQNLPYFIFEDDVKIKKDIDFTFESIAEKHLDAFWLIDLEPSSLAYVIWPQGAKKMYDWMVNIGKGDKGMDWKLLEIKNSNILKSEKIWDEYFYQVPGEDSDIAPNGYNLISK